MVESSEPGWLVLDGYEDEPAAFGVPPYVGFHVRYVCGVLETAGVPYEYITVDRYRQALKQNPDDVQQLSLIHI